MSETASSFSPMDVPTEGITNKRFQILLSPEESEIDANIAAAEPQYVERIRKGEGKLKVSSVTRLRAQYSSFIRRTRSSHAGGLEEPQEEFAAARAHRFVLDKDIDIGIGTTIRDIFGHYVKPFDVLGFFHVYDPNVLTETNLDDVHLKTDLQGDTAGALLLYDDLQAYDQWFPCLINVLRDPAVNQNELADLLLLHFDLENTINKVLDDPANKEKIASILKTKLRMSLEPLELLPLFHVYDPKVLVQDDIDAVTKITLEKGNEIGSDELIDRLVCYPGWHPCLMNVLRHVGLDHLIDAISEAINKEFSEIRMAEQRAKKKFKAQLKAYKRQYKAESALKKDLPTSITSEDLGEETKAMKKRESTELDIRKFLKDKRFCPRYAGLDWNKRLGPHRLSHLPTDVELADQKIQLLLTRERDEVSQEPGLHERIVDPWVQGEIYAEKYAISDLFTFMLTRVVLDKPERPLDYLIDMAGEINRLNTIRHEVDQLKNKREKAENEAAELKPTPNIPEQRAAQKEMSADTLGAKFKRSEQSRVTFK